MLHVGVVSDHNLKPEPKTDAKGRPYPRHYVWIRKLWLATPTNPDPVTVHPIPVFINRHHKDGNQDWEPLPIGTRVLVAEVDKAPLNREGLAVIAYGPQTDDPFGDTRETVNYRNYNGSSRDKVVLATSDPVTGPNEDYGRYHRDGDGMGWDTLRPYDNDPTRREMNLGIPGITAHLDHRTDESTCILTLTIAGVPRTYTIAIDAVQESATVSDDKGNSLALDSATNSWTITTVEGGPVTVNAHGDATVNSQTGDVIVNSAEGDVTVTADGDVSVTAGAAVNVEAEGNVTVVAGGAASVEAEGNITVTAGGAASVEAQGNVTVTAGGVASVDGLSVVLGGGGPAVARLGDTVSGTITGTSVSGGPVTGTFVGTVTTGSPKVNSG